MRGIQLLYGLMGICFVESGRGWCGVAKVILYAVCHSGFDVLLVWVLVGW